MFRCNLFFFLFSSRRLYGGLEPAAEVIETRHVLFSGRLLGPILLTELHFLREGSWSLFKITGSVQRIAEERDRQRRLISVNSTLPKA